MILGEGTTSGEGELNSQVRCFDQNIIPKLQNACVWLASRNLTHRESEKQDQKSKSNHNRIHRKEATVTVGQTSLNLTNITPLRLKPYKEKEYPWRRGKGWAWGETHNEKKRSISRSRPGRALSHTSAQGRELKNPPEIDSRPSSLSLSHTRAGRRHTTAILISVQFSSFRLSSIWCTSERIFAKFTI